MQHFSQGKDEVLPNMVTAMRGVSEHWRQQAKKTKTPDKPNIQHEVDQAFPAHPDHGELAAQMDMEEMEGETSEEAGGIGKLPQRDAKQIETFRQQIASVPDTADDGELQNAMDTALVDDSMPREEQTPSMSPLPKTPAKKIPWYKFW